jgi:hypothetical protein
LEVQHLKPEATMSIGILIDLERNNTLNILSSMYLQVQVALKHSSEAHSEILYCYQGKIAWRLLHISVLVIGQHICIATKENLTSELDLYLHSLYSSGG